MRTINWKDESSEEVFRLREQVEAQARDLHAYAQRVTQLGRALFVCRDALRQIIVDAPLPHHMVLLTDEGYNLACDALRQSGGVS